jgi:hypothetical protein
LLQEAGLVAQTRKRGPHRRKRERRPMTGMLLHIDASKHHWLGGEQVQQERVVNQDNTVRTANRTLQIERTKWRGTLANVASWYASMWMALGACSTDRT